MTNELVGKCGAALRLAVNEHVIVRSLLRAERLQLIPLSRDETENKYLVLEDSLVTN